MQTVFNFEFLFSLFSSLSYCISLLPLSRMPDKIEEIQEIEEPAQSQSENDSPLAKKTGAERVERPMPELASKNGDCWTYDEETWRRGGILIPVEVPNDEAPSEDVDVKSAKLILLFGKPNSFQSATSQLVR